MSDAPKKAGSRERVRTYLETHGLADEIFEFTQSTKTAAVKGLIKPAVLETFFTGGKFIQGEPKHVLVQLGVRVAQESS